MGLLDSGSGAPGGYYPTTSQTSGTSTTNSTSQGSSATTPSAAAYQAYYNALQNAANVASTPYEPYQGGLVAPMTPDQIAAFQGYQNAVNMQQPYITGAQNLYNQAFQYSDPSNYFNQIGNYYDPYNQIVNPYLQQAAQYQQNQFDLLNPANYQAGIQTYSNPYQQQVVNATMGQLGQLQNQLMGKNTSDAVRRGVYGGSGQFMGEAEIARQQGLSNAQTLAQLNAQNYENAQRQYNAQQGLGITSNQQALANALQQAGLRTGLYNQAGQNFATNRGAGITGALSAAQGLGGLGTQAQTGALQGLSALLQSGGLQQQQAQNVLNAAYNQWLQAKAYPYQNASYYSGLVSGVAPLMGAYQNQASSGTGTTNFNSSTLGMQPYASQSGGGGIMGAITAGAGILGDLLKLKTGGRAVSKADRKHYAYGGGEDGSVEQTEGDTPVAVKTTNISFGDMSDLIGKKPYEKGINPKVAKAAELYKLIPHPGDTSQEKLADAIKKAVETRTANLSEPPKPEAPTGIKSSADWFGGGDSGGGILGSLGDLASSYLDSKKSSSSTGSSESSSSGGGGFFDSMKDFFKADGGRVGYANGGGKTISQLMDEQSSLDLDKKLGAGVGSYDQLLAQAKSKGSGPQKTPVQQGRVAMPDSVYYRKRLPTYGFTQPTATTTDTSGTIGPSMSSQLAAMQAASKATTGTPAQSILTSGIVPTTGTTGTSDAATPRTGDNITFPDTAGVYAGKTITPAQKDVMNAAYLDQYAFINDMYSQYLGRRPTAAEAEKWVAAMGAGGAGTPGTGTDQQEYGTLPSNLTPMQVQNWFATHSTERINALKPVVQGYYQQIGSGGINPETGMPDINYVGEYYSPGYTSQLSDVQTTSNPYFDPYAPGVPESAHAEGAIIPNIPGKTDQFGNPIKKNRGGRVGRKKGGRIGKSVGGSFDPYDPVIDKIANGIAAIESGGRYHITGPRSKRGDMPYGKYQIMGSNIPKWGAEAGYPGLTPSQFLASPKIQEDVARTQFAKIYGRTGDPTHVAGEWLGGPGWRSNKHADVLGTTVPTYIQRFNAVFKGSPKGTMFARAPETSSSPSSAASSAAGAPEAEVEKPKSFGELLAKVAADVGKKQETEKESPAPEMAKLEVIEPPKASGPTLADLQQISMAETPMKLGRSKGGRLHFQDGGSGWLDTLLGSEANPATRDYKTRAELSSPEEEAAYSAGASATGIPGLDYARSVLRGLKGEVSGADMSAFGQRYKEEMARHNARMQEAERLRREHPEAYRGGHLAGSEYAPGAEAGFFAQPGLASAARGAVQRSFSNPIYRASNAAFERVNPNVKYDFGNIMEGPSPALKVRDNSQGWHLYDRPAYGSAPKEGSVPNWRMQGPTQQQNVVDLHQQRLADINAGLNPKLRTPAAKFLGTSDMGVNMSRAQNIDPALVNAIAERQGAKGALGHAYATGRLGEINPITGAQEIPGGFVPKGTIMGRRDFTAAERANVMPGSTNKLEAQYVRGIKGLGENYTPPTQGMNYEDYGKVPLKAHELRRAANQNLGPVSQEAIDELEAFRSKGTPSRAPFRPTDFEGGVEAPAFTTNQIPKGWDLKAEGWQGVNPSKNTRYSSPAPAPEANISSGESPNLFKPKDAPKVEGSIEEQPGALNFGVKREGYQAPKTAYRLPERLGPVTAGAAAGGLGALGTAMMMGDGTQGLAPRNIPEVQWRPDITGGFNKNARTKTPTIAEMYPVEPRVVADESATRPTHAAKPRKAKSAAPKASGEKYWGDWRDAPGFSEDPIGNFFDSLMGETKSSSKKGHLANGGMARRGYNKGGQPMDLDPLSAIGEGLGGLGNAIGEGLGGLFGQEETPAPKERPVKAPPKEKVVAGDEVVKPAAPAAETPKTETPSLFGEGRPLMSPSVSNALIAAGLGMMASPARSTLRAIGEGGLMGFKYYQAAAEEERKRQRQEEEIRAANKAWGNSGSLGDLEPKTVASDEEAPAEKPTAPVPGVTTPTVPAGPKTPTVAPSIANKDDEIRKLIESHYQTMDRINSFPITPGNEYLEKLKDQRIKHEEAIIKRLEQRLKDQQEKEKIARDELKDSPDYVMQTEGAKKAAAKVIDEEEKINKAASNAQSLIDQFEVYKRAIEKGVVPTGFGGETRNEFNKALNVVGMGDTLQSELADEIKSGAVTQMLRQMGDHLGAGISDADRKAIERTTISLDRDPNSNLDAIIAFQNAQKRALALQEFKQKYKEEHGYLDAGFLDAEQEWVKKQPSLIPPRLKAKLDLDTRTKSENKSSNPYEAEMRKRGLI